MKQAKWLMTALLLMAAVAPVAGQAVPSGRKETRMIQPKVRDAGDGAFEAREAPLLWVGKGLQAAGPEAAQAAQEWLSARFGAPVEAAQPKAALPDSPVALVGLPADHPELKRLAQREKPRLPKSGLGAEGYLLEVGPKRILLTAERPAGIFYGVQRLKEQAAAAEKGLTLPGETVADWPTMARRGMHVLIHSRSELPHLEKLLTQFLPQMRMNALIVEINYVFQYKSHPEIAEPGGLTVEDARRVSRLAKANFVRLTPMINCLGHQSWAKNTGRFLKAHPEFDETPDLPADNPGIYCRSWCPSHPDVNKFVFALFDELIDAFQADSFHVGLDEVFILGECPRCKGKDNADLFAKAVNDYHRHLVGKRKVEMQMWGDRLLDSEATGYGKWEASANGTAPAIGKIPKDIVICDWHYEKLSDYPAMKSSDYPSVKSFQEQGFRVWPSGWNKTENARKLADSALRNSGEKMVGYMATTWMGVTGVAGVLSSDRPRPQGNQSQPDLAAAIREGGRIAWEGRAEP